MPRTKTTRDFLGSIFERRIRKHGRMITVYDARKRYLDKDEQGNPVLDAKGRKVYKDKTQRCYTKAEAQIALLNLPTEIERDKAKKTQRATVGHSLFELIESFRAEYVVPARYADGEKIVGYKGNLAHIETILDEIKEYFVDNPPLPEITFARLREFKRHLQSTPIKRHPKSKLPPRLPALSTVNEKLAFLNRVFTVAFEKEWLVVNPFKKGKGLIKQSKRKKRNRPLTFAEEIAVYNACQPHDQIIPVKRIIKRTPASYTQTFHVDRRHLWHLVVASVDTSLRAGEVFNLRWWQIDLERRVIYLTEEAADQTKTGEPGILPMTERLYNTLSLYRRPGSRPHDKIFRKWDYGKMWANVCREAGITNLQFRDLRNTASNRMLKAGGSGPQVRKITRHRSDEVFQDHYVSIDLASAQFIGSRMDEYIAEEYRQLGHKENVKGNDDAPSEAKAA